MSLSRRAFLAMSAAAPAAIVVACRRPGTVEERLVESLGLSPEQQSWAAELSPEDQQHLLDVLTHGRGDDDRSRRILFDVVGRRDRLFAFAAGAQAAARRSPCDGLLRE